MFLLCLYFYWSKKGPRGPSAEIDRSSPFGEAGRRAAGRPLCGFTAGKRAPFDHVLLDLKRSKQKIIWMKSLIAFSGGQDSINLVILWKNLLGQPLPWASPGHWGWGEHPFLSLKNKPSIIWCHHIWKIPDFYLFRHSFQISFIFNQRFFYTIFFSKYFSEKKARKWRYFSFLRVARYSGYDSILTAHTQNDSIETFFMNLFRGSGPFGLQTLRNLQIFFNDECSQTFY